jgi:hypothetical protein
MPPNLMGDYTQKVQRVHATGIVRQDFTVSRLGLRQAARLVMLDRGAQQLRGVVLGHCGRVPSNSDAPSKFSG